MGTQVVILGAGGHGRVLVDVLRLCGVDVVGVTAPDNPGAFPVPWLGDDDMLAGLHHAIQLINGVGSVGVAALRQRVFQRGHSAGRSFASVRHPRALVGGHTAFGEGVQLLAGCIINTGARLGANVLINTGAIVEHDCRIGDHTHVATGALVCGGCHVGASVHVGAGAVVNQGITIGDHSVIASGSVVVEDVAASTLVAGVPARVKKRLEP